MDSAKPGDVKRCTRCGEEKFIYGRVLRTTELVIDDEPQAKPVQPGDQYAWACEACGFEDRVPS
jgi:hypothetical protein